MAAPGSTSFTVFDELTSTTYRNHQSEVADNFSNHNALFRRLNKKGKVKTYDGGISITHPLEYAANSTYQRYSGYDTLNIGPSEVITAVEYPWKQVSVAVVASGREIRINSGRSQIVPLVTSRVRNAMNTFKNNFSVDMYSDGSAPNQINGLQALIADTGVGTIGNINSSLNPWWQNTVQSAASPLQGGGAVVYSATTIEGMMSAAWTYATRGGDTPDFIVMSRDLYLFYEASQVTFKRYSSSDSADGGIVNLKFHSADVFWDDSIPSGHAYFLNTDYIYLFAHPDANMDMMPDRKSVNQDAIVKLLLWMGNMLVTNRRLQLVMKA